MCMAVSYIMFMSMKHTYSLLISAAELWLTHVRPATTMTDCKADGEKWSTMAPERVIIVVCELHRLCMQSRREGHHFLGCGLNTVAGVSMWLLRDHGAAANNSSLITPATSTFLLPCFLQCAVECVHLNWKQKFMFLSLAFLLSTFDLDWSLYSTSQERRNWVITQTSVFARVKFHLVKHFCTPICRVKETVTVMLVLPKILYIQF